MKRLLIPLLAALSLPTAAEVNWFGKYGSFREANEACDDWAIKKGKVRVSNYEGSPGGFEYELRFCEIEEKTNQILGLEYINLKPRYYKRTEYYKIKDGGKVKVKKRFKY